MIKEHREVILERSQEIQKQKIFQKWIELAKICPIFTSTSFNGFKQNFIKKDILDPFYCMTIDLFRDFQLWRHVLGTNFSRIKFTKRFESITLQDIYEINNVIKDSFDDFNPQDISIECSPHPDISIGCLPHLDLTMLEGEYSDRVKSSIIEILQSWIVAWKKDEKLDEKDYVHLFIISPLHRLLGGLLNYVTLHGPEHPTYCSYERKSYFFDFSFKDEDISDCQIFNQYSPENGKLDANVNPADEIQDTVIVNIQKPKYYRRYSRNGSVTVVTEDLINPEKYTKGITSKKKYRKKVDVAISFRVDKGMNGRGEKRFGYLYPILGEVKLPGINGDDDYKKNNRALNDNFNTIIKYYSKKARRISKKLQKLFDGIKLCGIHASEGEIYLLQYARLNQRFGVLTDINSAKVPSKFEDQQAGQMIDFLYCIKVMVQDFIRQIKKIENEVRRINEYPVESDEEFDNLGEFLKSNILNTPSSPKR